MHIIEKKVYYCDFCSRHTLTSGSLKLHEAKCLHNPQRRCAAPYCQYGIGFEKEDIDFIINSLKDENYEVTEETTSELEDRTGCPVCVLGLLIEAQKRLRLVDKGIYWHYDFQKHQKQFYNDYQEEQQVY